MKNLKLTIFWAAIYLGMIFILGNTDYIGRPVINFASYFYVTVLIAFPVTMFFPSISRASPFVPLLVWAGFYLVVLQVIDRGPSTKALQYSVIVLEFILLEVGVWLAYRLAVQISHAESALEALALSAFPSRAASIDDENQRIKVEFSRSRRYLRPLSLVVIETRQEDEKRVREMLKTVQHDLSQRFNYARVGQIIDECVRQTDLILKDQKGRFVILCPETGAESATLLARRITRAVQDRTDTQVHWGVAAFPDDARSFDEMVQKARLHLSSLVAAPAEPKAEASSQ